MSSAKTLNLLAAAHSYEMQNKRVKVMKPAMDIRFGAEMVESRAGIGRAADQLLDENSTFPADSLAGINCVLVDEAQFLHPRVIERLRDVATDLHIPVMCYGLRTDFRSRLFPGSKRLLELADTIEEVKTTCTFCNKKAIANLKSVDGLETMEGPTVCLGGEEMYVPACYMHFCERIVSATGRPIDFQAAWAAGDALDAAAQQQADAKVMPNGKVGDVSLTRGGYADEPEIERSPQEA